MAFINPQATNVYIPDFDASGRLQVDFVRNPSRFKLARYAKYQTTTTQKGVYMRMSLDEQARIINSNLSDFSWPDGNPRPIARNALAGFEFLQYTTKRFAYDWIVGDLTREQAVWNFESVQTNKTLQQAITGRTVWSVDVLTNPANWNGHTIEVEDIPGVQGPWDQSTVARQDIQKSLNWVRNQIRLATTSAVNVEQDLVLIVNPNTAAAITQCQELVDFYRGSYWTREQLTGRNPSAEAGNGAPDDLYKMPLIVEDAVRVTSQKGAPTESEFIFPDGVGVVAARPGGLDAPPGGGPTFSTLTVFIYKGDDMSVVSMEDPFNRCMFYGVTDHFVPVLTAPVSGYLLTGLTTPA